MIKLSSVSEIGAAVEIEFCAIRERLVGLLPRADVQHIGATSVPGAVTKGDLDVMVRVSSTEFDAAVQVLKAVLVVHQPENWDEGFASFTGSLDHELPVGIQLVASGSDADFFTFFRDYLIRNPQAIYEYNRLKVEHAVGDPEEYWKAKHDFISKILSLRTL